MARRCKGEGSIFKRKDGRWCGFITIGYNEKGNQKKKYFYGKSGPEVAEKIRKAQNEIDQGFILDTSKITFGNWLNTWLWTYKKNQVKSSTFESYETIIRIHILPTVGNLKLKNLRPVHLQNLYNTKLEEGLSTSKIKHIHTIIHSALEQAIKNGLLSRNVSKAVNIPKQSKKKEIKVLTLEEEKRFLQALENERLKSAFILSLTTGLRLGELLALKWHDVDFSKKTLNIHGTLLRVKTYNETNRKTALIVEDVKTSSSRRTIPLPEVAVNELLKYKELQQKEKEQAGKAYIESDFVFTTSVGTPIEPRNFQRTFYRIIKKAGLAINFHALRHTFATRLLESNEHPKVVQELLGHKDITTTLNVYSHVLPEKKESVAKKIDNLFKSFLEENK